MGSRGGRPSPYSVTVLSSVPVFRLALYSFSFFKGFESLLNLILSNKRVFLSLVAKFNLASVLAISFQQQGTILYCVDISTAFLSPLLREDREKLDREQKCCKVIKMSLTRHL